MWTSEFTKYTPLLFFGLIWSAFRDTTPYPLAADILFECHLIYHSYPGYRCSEFVSSSQELSAMILFNFGTFVLILYGYFVLSYSGIYYTQKCLFIFTNRQTITPFNYPFIWLSRIRLSIIIYYIDETST